MHHLLLSRLLEVLLAFLLVLAHHGHLLLMEFSLLHLHLHLLLLILLLLLLMEMGLVNVSGGATTI